MLLQLKPTHGVDAEWAACGMLRPHQRLPAARSAGTVSSSPLSCCSLMLYIKNVDSSRSPMHTMAMTNTNSCHSRPPTPPMPPLKALCNFLWEVMIPEVSCPAASSAPKPHPCVRRMNEVAMSCNSVDSAPPSNWTRNVYLAAIMTISEDSQSLYGPIEGHCVNSLVTLPSCYIVTDRHVLKCVSEGCAYVRRCAKALTCPRVLFLSSHQGLSRSYTNDACLLEDIAISMPLKHGSATTSGLA